MREVTGGDKHTWVCMVHTVAPAVAPTEKSHEFFMMVNISVRS